MSQPTADVVVTILGGGVSLQKDCGLPWLEEVVAQLDAIGCPNEPAIVEQRYPDAPVHVYDPRPMAAFEAFDLLVGFAVYVGVRLSDAALSSLGEDVYNRAFKASVSGLWRSMRQHGRNRPIRARLLFEHWFDQTGVLVRVVIVARDSDPTPDAGVLVSQALRASQRWVDQHGVTHRVMTWQVRNGALSDIPELEADLTGF